nr:NAD(P)-dependent oxidoreductase [uncultured Anaerostipes sp.]
MKNVLVTGASGFIGKTLIEALTKIGIKVIALARHFDEELSGNCLVECIDVSGVSVSELAKILPTAEYDCMFHLAWAGTSGPTRASYEIQLDNVKMSCQYIELANAINCKRVIYASSINEMETYEYLQSDNIEPSGGYIYGTGKLAAHLMGETVAKMNNVEFIPVIITNIYGVGEKSARMIYTSIKKLINKEHCSFTAGYQTYDFIYITDAINSIIEVAEKGKAFNRYYIGSGEPKPLREFLMEMRDFVDPEAEIGLGDMPFKGVDISYEQFDLKKIEKDTGYKNKVSFAEGIKMTAEYIRNGEQ